MKELKLKKTIIKEIKRRMDEKLATPAPRSKPKSTNKQMLQTKKPTNQENYDGIGFEVSLN